jgi:lipid II:glycine glycyltransferase (peptidoglycan interpeptide bridge formation enzyme)
MLEIENSKFIFKTKEIWFSEVPFDIHGFDGVTFRECLKDVNIEGFSKEEFTTLMIDLTQDLNTIWEKMHKTACRRSIERAKKEGVIIRVNQDYDTFLTIHSEFRKLKGLPEYNIDVEYMKKNGVLFLSELQGKIIGGQFYLSDDKNTRILFGSSRRLEDDRVRGRVSGNSNRLIIWEAIKYAKEKGIVNFDMGGYYTGKKPDPQKESINIFKKSFGGEVVTHYIYHKDYSRLYSVAKWVYLKYKNLIRH